MALIGEIPRYLTGCDWQVYAERLEQFFEINDVPAEKKKALLITSIGEDVYKTLRDLCHPALPKSKTYAELIELLNKQFCMKTSVFRERVKFYNAKQNSNETIANWFARIKKLSVDCKFGDQFESILLDRFVSGLRPSPVLDRICEEEAQLKLQQAVDLALSKESSGVVGEGDPNGDGGAPQQTKRTYQRRAPKRKAPEVNDELY